MVGSLLLLVSGVAVTSPPSTALALESYPHVAGTASSLLGVARFAFGGLAAPLVGIAGPGTAVPLGVVATCAALVSLAGLRLLRPRTSATHVSPGAPRDDEGSFLPNPETARGHPGGLGAAPGHRVRRTGPRASPRPDTGARGDHRHDTGNQPHRDGDDTPPHHPAHRQHELTGALPPTAAGRDFAHLLPLTVTLSDFHGTERVADLPRRLDTTGAPAGDAGKAGDIAYYAPWGNLALYYRDSPYADGLVVLGRLDADAAATLAGLEEDTRATLTLG